MSEKDYVAKRPSGDEQYSEEMKRWFGQNDVLCMYDYLHVYQGRPSYTPERRLMAAVLRDAIDCYITDCFNAKRHKKRSYREAEEWFFSGDDHGVFSLYNVCGILDVEPGYIRRMLVRYKEENEAGAGAMGPEREHSNIELALAS